MNHYLWIRNKQDEEERKRWLIIREELQRFFFRNDKLRNKKYMCDVAMYMYTASTSFVHLFSDLYDRIMII